MKSFLNGLKKVFGFTVRHRLTKGWKTATLIVMLLFRYLLPFFLIIYLLKDIYKLEVINIFANIPYLLTVHHTHKLGGHNCP